MKAIEKHIQRSFWWTQPVTVLCIALIVFMSDRTVWANITAMPVSVARPQPAAVTTAPATVQVPEINWRFMIPSVSDSLERPNIMVQGTVIGMEYISNVELVGEKTLKFSVWDSTKVEEVKAAMYGVNTQIVVSVVENDLYVSFPRPIVEDLREAWQGQALELSKIKDGNTQNLIWACIVLVGIGVGTYYGMKYLCKKAGLIPPTPPPPPVVTNPPPVPPKTNQPPTWTNGGPVTIVVAGITPKTLTTAMMPESAYSQFLRLFTPGKPLFKVESDDPSDPNLYGMAVWDSTGFNELYSSTNYVDPEGRPYIRCLRTTMQSSPTVTGTNWQSLVTTYIWINDYYVCFNLRDPAGVSRENVIVKKGPNDSLPGIIEVQSYEHVVKRSWYPSAERYFRTTSGL